jgi:hypothetical protein
LNIQTLRIIEMHPAHQGRRFERQWDSQSITPTQRPTARACRAETDEER